MSNVVILGANGQLGIALGALYPDATMLDSQDLDITDHEQVVAYNWPVGGVVLNAAAYTAVDAAETPEGRRAAWNVNAAAVANLSRVATEKDLTLVHISSDYVFDGTNDLHTEEEPFAPLGVYGQTKAAGDIAAATTPKHYIVRTSWVVGEGNNFVKTMKMLVEKGVKPSVVSDQIGRLTFTDTLAAGIKYLLDTNSAYGTYNLTNDGKPASWADIAKLVYAQAGGSADDVTPVTTAQYYEGKENISPRPLQSTLDLSKITATGFTPSDWHEALASYVAQL